MQCHEVRRSIPDLIDGLLDFEEEFAVRQHINTCDQCYEVFRAYEHDEVAITQHVHRAPFAPVARDVIDEIEKRGRSPWWDAFMAGSYRLAGVAGLVLVILVVAAGGLALREMGNSNGDEPVNEQPAQDSMLGAASQEADEDASQQDNLIGRGNIPQIVERLQDEGLVADVAAGFGSEEPAAGGGTYEINYRRMAFDRHLTLLEYDIDASESGDLAVEVVDADQPDETLGSAQRTVGAGQSKGWIVLPPLDPGTAERSLTIRSEVNGESSDATPQVDVDLSALQELPAPRPYSTSAYSNGVELCCLEIERGVAVSVLRMSQQIDDPDALVPAEQPPAPLPRVTVDGEPVMPLDNSFGLTSAGTGTQSVAVFGLPETGELSIQYEYLTLGDELSGEEQPTSTQGPWTLTAELGQPQVEPDPTPEPTIPPNVAEDDSTPTPEPTPAPDDEADNPETLRVLVYLERNGELAAAAREIDYTRDVATASMNELLAGLTSDEQDFALGTAIPEGTELLDISLEDGTITVNLSREFGVSSAGATSLQMRMAQVVHTLTQFQTVDSVEILVEGQPVAPRGGAAGDIEEEHYTREDFESVAPAILLESPAPGEVVSGPLELRGTSNTFEANMQIEVIDASGEVIYQGHTTATSGTGTRGTFEFTTPLELNKEGWGTVRMYESSARDGSPTNVVEIPVRFEVGCVSCLEDGSGVQESEGGTP